MHEHTWQHYGAKTKLKSTSHAMQPPSPVPPPTPYVPVKVTHFEHVDVTWLKLLQHRLTRIAHMHRATNWALYAAVPTGYGHKWGGRRWGEGGTMGRIE